MTPLKRFQRGHSVVPCSRNLQPSFDLTLFCAVQVICTAGPADVRASLTCLVTRLQKFCNTNIGPPNVMRVGLIGKLTPHPTFSTRNEGLYLQKVFSSVNKIALFESCLKGCF
jgi:hypothetical protein